jgi:hypothetical protein
MGNLLMDRKVAKRSKRGNSEESEPGAIHGERREGREMDTLSRIWRISWFQAPGGWGILDEL